VALLFRILLVLVIAAVAYVCGRGGWGWGGGDGDGDGPGDGGPPVVAPADAVPAHAWSVRVTGDSYELNGKPISLAEMRAQFEKAKDRIQEKNELVHIVVMPNARVNSRREVKEMLVDLGLSTAEESR
jgi:hypothetical protein